MISILNQLQKINSEELKKIAGVYYIINHCIGDKCQRYDHPKGGRCEWMDEILLSDKLVYETKGDYNKTIEKETMVPVRYYNFLFSMSEVEKKFANLPDAEKINKALYHARINCFDVDGKPENMAKKLGYTSYNTFIHSFCANI